MANVLDENVVILKFDNSDFQKNTQDSISSLDKLKASLDKSGSGEGLKGLGKAAKSFNLDNMSNAVDKVNKRFSLFGVAGMATINRLTNSAITATKNMVTAIPKQIIQGGWQRALNIEQAQNLIDGLGFAWDVTSEKYEKGMKTVKTAVDNAVTGTRYALDEAAIVASQLLSSGVKDTEKLEESLKSISGLASVLNADYGDIGRIFAQVSGQGRMMGDDLLQLQQRGIGAAEEIGKYLTKNEAAKKAAIDTAIATGRTVEKFEAIRNHAEITGADVRELVSVGAIDFDILSNSFRDLFNQAEKANDTYTGSLANLKSAMNRIGESFETYKLKNFTKLFNALIPVVKRIKTFTDPLADSIGKVSDNMTKFLVNNVINKFGKAIGAENLYTKLADGAKKAGDETKKANDKTKKSNDSLTKSLKVSKKEWQAALDIWYKGTYGKGQERADAIRKLGMSYENVQGIINKFYETGFDWKKTEAYYTETKKVTEENEKLGDSAEKAAPKLSTLGSIMAGIMNVVQIVKNVFVAFKNVLVVVGKFMVSLFSGPVKTGAEGFLKLTEYLTSATKKLADFTKKLKDKSVDQITSKWPKAFQAIFKGLKSGLGWIVSHIGPAFRTILDFFKQLSVSDGVVKLKETLSDLFKTASDAGGGALKTVVDKIKEIANIGSSGGGLKAVVDFFSKLAGGLADFINKIRAGESPFKILTGAISDLREKLSFKGVQGIAGKGGIGAKISDVLNFGSIGKIGEKIKGLEIGEKLKGMFTGLVDLVKNADVLEKLKSLDFGGFFKTLGEKLGEVDWDRIIELATKIGGLVAAFVALRDMRKVTDAAVGTMGSVSGFFTSLSGVSDVIKKKIKMESFKAMAIAIAILVGCIVALTLIPTKRLIPAMAGVLGILGAMTAIIAYMNSDKFDAEKLKSVGIAFAGMGASILLLGAGMALIAKLKVGDIVKAGIAIVAFVGMLVLASKLSGDISGAGGAFIGLATAVNLLLVAMLGFAALAVATIIKGGLVILGLVTSLALAARIANGSKTGGFVSMANAVNLLIPAITAFALMPTARILKGGLAVVGLVTALGLAARIAGEGSLKGMTGISVAVAVLTASLVTLSMVDTEKLIAAGSALVGLMLSLSVAAKLAQKSVGGMIAMALVLSMMSVALIGLASLDVHAPLEICASLSMLALSLAGSLALFALITPAGVGLGLAGLAIAIVGVGTMLAGIGKLDDILGEGKIKNFIDKGIPILVSIASGMGQVIGAFASGLLAQLASGGLPVVAKNLSKFMEELRPFFDSVKDQESMAAAVGTIKQMASAFAELGKANLMNSISTFLGGENVDMEEFGKQIRKFVKPFKKFAKEAGEISDDDLKAASVVAKVAKAFGEIQSALGTTGGLKGLVMGNKQDLGDFGESIGDAVTEISRVIFKLRVYKFTDEDAALIKPIAKILTAFSELQIPEGTSLKSLIAGGELGLDTFGEQIGTMVDSVSGLIFRLREYKFTEDDAALIAPIVSIIEEFAGLELPEGTSFKSIMAGGPQDLASFADTLVTFAERFKTFVERTADIDEASFASAIPKIQPIANAVTAMATAANAMPETGGVKQFFMGGKDLGSFGVQLLTFAFTIKPFIKKVGKLEIPADFTTKLSQLAKIVSAMAKVAQAVPDDEGVFSKLKNLIKLKIDEAAITSVVKSVKAVDTNTKGLSAANVKTFASAVRSLGSVVDDIKSLKGIPSGHNLPTLASNIKSMVDTMGDVNVKGLKSKASAVKRAASDMAKAAGSNIKVNTSGASKSAGDLGNAMVKGISGKVSSVKTAAKKLASAANDGVKGNTSGFTSAGKACAEGFARGVNSGKYLATNAGSAIGRAALAAAKRAVDSKSPSKEFMKLGRFSSEGFAIGILQLKDQVEDSGYEMAKASLDGANGALTMIDDFSAPVITPVIDLSNVQRGAQTIDSMLSSSRAMDVNSVVAQRLTMEYERSQAMDRLVDMMGKPRNDRQVTNYNNITVDGAENPELFASRLMRSLEMEARTV